jgi:hypothetical protein
MGRRERWRRKAMLIYTEVTLAELSRGDHVVVEISEVQIAASVVGTDLEQDVLAFVPLSFAEPTENGAGFTIARCHPVTHDSKVFAVTPGKSEVRLFKTKDFEVPVTEPLTWEYIAELEPRVLQLLVEIKTEYPTEANYQLVWRNYKERLSELVGWGREATAHPELQSPPAYDVVYDKLLHALRDAH